MKGKSMLAYIYILSMAVAFTNMFNGMIAPFYLKYFIAIFWIIFWLFDISIKQIKIETRIIFSVKEYILPFIYIGIWSLFVWIIDTPENFSGVYVSRMLANVIYIILTYLCAIASTHFFGRNTIKLSVLAMVLSVLVNLFYVVSQYGIGVFLFYIPHVLATTDYQWGSLMYNFALALEVQDITIATGFYLIYFIFFDKEDTKRNKVIFIALILLCAYIGFKRTTLIGLFLVFITMWLIRRKGISFKKIVYLIGIPYIIVCLAYVALVKLGLVELISAKLNIDANGRIGIYSNLSKFFELSPFYLGKGFSYVDKVMYETTNFVAHSVVVKMFAEIGCIPFLIWMYHYLINIPKKIYYKFGINAGYVAFSTTLYLFATFLMENTLTLFCVQFSFIMIPLATTYPYIKGKRIRFKI